MKKKNRCILVIFYLCPIVIFAAQINELTAVKVLDNVKSNFFQIKDYTVNIHAELDMEDINVPPMDVKVYFKQPDKIHLESDGFAMLPREGIFLNPGNFNEENFYISLLGMDTVNTAETYKLELVPRKDEIMIRKFIIWVNLKQWTITKMNTISWQGQTAEFLFEYELIKKKHYMPKKIVADLNLAGFKGFAHRRNMQTDKKDTEEKKEDKRGKLTVLFSNYKINKGISDKIFEINN